MRSVAPTDSQIFRQISCSSFDTTISTTVITTEGTYLVHSFVNLSIDYFLVYNFSRSLSGIVSTKSARLLSLSRLRTVRESFSSYGSSILSRQSAVTLDMFKAVAVHVNHIIDSVCAAVLARSFKVYSSFFRQVNRFGANRAYAFLIFPYSLEFSRQSSHSVLKLTFFKIFRLQIRICACPNFYVSDYRCVCCFLQFGFLGTEHPVS